jgi:pimeloyl-ACP methyl ester carboxylesterase
MIKQAVLVLIASSVILALVKIAINTHYKTESANWEAGRYFPDDGDFVQVGYPPKGLHYIRRGKGPTVVLIHGDGGSTYDWTMANFNRLAESYDVVAIDRPGFGFSETLPHQSIMGQVRYIHRGLQLMGIRQPVLVGHSRGGEVATLFAEEYPDEIAGVVTLGGVCFNTDSQQPAWPYNLQRTPAWTNLFSKSFITSVDQSSVKAGLDHAFSPEGTSPKAYTNAFLALLIRPQTLENWQIDHDAAILDSLIIPRYGSIRVPFVVVNGQADHNVPISMARRYSRMIPGARLIEVPGAGHELMFHHPDVVEQAIRLVLEKKIR